MKGLVICVLFFGFLGSCTDAGDIREEVIPKAKHYEQSQFFWDNLYNLCGKSFTGKVVKSPPNDTSFLNKNLIMHFIRCDSGKIEAAFHVDTDRSRILTLEKKDQFLELTHQHTYESGELSQNNYYGGCTVNQGLYNIQFFPANQHTSEMIPGASGNVWWLQLEPDKHFTYNLRRLGTDREFSFEFDLSRTTELPEDPWGWNR